MSQKEIPRKIKVASTLVMVSALILVLPTLLLLVSLNARPEVSVYLLMLLFFVLTFALSYFIRKGKKWPRGVILLMAIFFAALFFTRLDFMAITEICFTILYIVFLVWALTLLFSSDKENTDSIDQV